MIKQILTSGVLLFLSAPTLMAQASDSGPNKSAHKSDELTPFEWVKHEIQAPIKTAINSAVAVDVDQDGHLDVIATYANAVYVHQGPDWQARNVFDFRTLRDSGLKFGKACIHSCLIDVDRDGDLDYIGSNQHLFWLECPDEALNGQTWKHRVIDQELSGSHCTLAGDVNLDGQADLIANSFAGAEKTKFPNSIAWFEAPTEKEGAWKRHVFADKDAPGGSHYMGLGDLNQDGLPDITCGAKGEPFANGNWFAWWEQVPGQQAWRKHTLANDQVGASNIDPADVNGDEHMDLIATRGHGQGVLWFRGPDFQPSEIDSEIAGPHTLVTADLDGDGDTDIAVCGRAATGTAAWFQNDGNGTFKRFDIDQGQSSYDLRAVDLDGDGDLDLLSAGHFSKNIVWYESKLK